MVHASNRFYVVLLLSLVFSPLILSGLLIRYKYLLLKVPSIGYVLFAIAGGEVPPYFDGKIFEVEDQWRREGDVFASVCTKCGTTWMMNTLHAIRTRGRPPKYNDLYEEVRWAEFVYYPGMPLEERVDVLKGMHDKYSISAYKTHKFPPVMRIRNDAKYVVAVRSIPDVVASMRTMFHGMSPKFAKLWGGFPAEAGTPVRHDNTAYERFILEDSGDGVNSGLDALVLNIIRGFWPYRKQKNVLFVHYSDRVKNHKGEISRIAKFIGINLSSEELDLVTERTSFTAMKRDHQMYDLQHLFDKYKAEGKFPNSVDYFVKNMVNVGPSRSAEKELSPAFYNKIKAKVLKDFGPEIAQWLLEGGSLPDVDLSA